jgi:PKD domain
MVAGGLPRSRQRGIMLARAGPLLLMRRRPHVLVLVVGAAAALLLSAPALSAPPPWLSPETAALFNPGTTQQSPAIAVDPDVPLSAAVVADDGGFSPPHTATTSTADWSTGGWTPAGSINHSSSTTAGQPDIAWGIDGSGAQNVDLVETGSSLSGSLCNAAGGVFFSTSSNGGAGWNTAFVVNSASNSSELVEPAIAVDRGSGILGRIYVVYTKLDWAVPGCNGPPDSSQILLAYSDNGGISWPTRRVSPLATTGAAHFRSPAVAVQPDGRVTVAFRNDGAASPQIESETCRFAPSPPATDYCGGPSAGLVGASTVVGDATAPAIVSGVAGAPTPSVVAAGGRVTVAWHASSGNGVRAFAAMSTDGGTTFGPPQQIDPSGAGNQVAPDLATTAGGRVDVAYLWDVASTGSVVATSASAAAPLPGATTEAWSNPVVVQSVAASATTPISGQIAPLGRRLGIATSSVGSPLPATVVAFTDTSSGSQDVHVAAVLHGTTTPVIAAQTVTASKNNSTIVHVDASDADGDPLTWSTGAQPTTPGSSVTTADQARGQFAFNAANVVGADTFEAVANDGAGHEARTMINVNVVNDPPKITCSVVIAREDTPRPIAPDDCVTDPNHDPITIELSGATGGTVERTAGIWYFVPKHQSIATGSFILHASDGDKSADATVLVTVASTIGKVILTVPDAGKRREIVAGAALRLVGHAVDSAGNKVLVGWDFGDHTPKVRGPLVAHRFRKPGTYTVVASASNADPKKIKVVVRRRAVELVGAPSITDGVMELTVRTRAAGKLFLRADSRSQTSGVPAGLTQQTLHIQVTTGPLVRLILRLTPSKKSLPLRVFSVRRLVLVSPLSAG